jgi:hypothetical protein
VAGGAQALVVGGLGGQVGEQVPEPPAGEAQPASLGRTAEQDLRDGQADQFGVAELGSPSRPNPRAEQVIDSDVQCRDEGVEIGAHEASQEVDEAVATSTLGALVSLVIPQHPRPHSESII